MEKAIVATILFADLMNSTEMAKNLMLKEYDEMIVDFQSIMFEVVSNHLKDFGYVGEGVDSEWSIIGDELRVFLYSGALRFDVRNVLLIAVKIKLAWLASAFNQRILKEGRLVSRVGVGINCGKVIKEVRQWRASMGSNEPNIEGYAINITKRIESATRDGTAYQVMAGDSLYRACRDNRQINVSFSRPLSPIFKGLGQKIPVYEVVSFLDCEIVPSMPATFQKGLLGKMEYAVSQPMAEPWAFIVLLRHYISLIDRGRTDFESRTVKLAHQALEVLEHQITAYNILGWLHTYGKTVCNLDMATQYFGLALELEPANQAALLHRARIFDMMGQTELAVQAYKEILVHNSDHVEARRKVDQYGVVQG
jgi:class 3 adenylate cyclase